MSLERMRIWVHNRRDKTPCDLIPFQEVLNAIEICMGIQEAEEGIKSLNREKEDLWDELKETAMNNHLVRQQLHERLAEIEDELHATTCFRNGKEDRLFKEVL